MADVGRRRCHQEADILRTASGLITARLCLLQPGAYLDVRAPKHCVVLVIDPLRRTPRLPICHGVEYISGEKKKDQKDNHPYNSKTKLPEQASLHYNHDRSTRLCGDGSAPGRNTP